MIDSVEKKGAQKVCNATGTAAHLLHKKARRARAWSVVAGRLSIHALNILPNRLACNVFIGLRCFLRNE